MSFMNGHEIYKMYKDDLANTYLEHLHCPMVVDFMNSEGTMIAFCKEAKITEGTFYKWLERYPIFKKCYEYGKILSYDNWEKEGDLGQQDENFNFDHWRLKGIRRYRITSDKIKVKVTKDEDPYKQYQSIMQQAGEGDFTASELKQIMESINVGVRAFESFKLQEQVEKMQEDVKLMAHNNGFDSTTIEQVAKTD